MGYSDGIRLKYRGEYAILVASCRKFSIRVWNRLFAVINHFYYCPLLINMASNAFNSTTCREFARFLKLSEIAVRLGLPSGGFLVFHFVI